MRFLHHRKGHAAWITLILFACGGEPLPGSISGPTTDAQLTARQETPSDPTDSASVPVEAFPSAVEHRDANLVYVIIDAPNGTFGYDISSDGRLLIHQTNIPGQPGVEGCKNRADAQKLAAFVMEKIKNGEMPPTVTDEELSTLGLKPEQP